MLFLNNPEDTPHGKFPAVRGKQFHPAQHIVMPIIQEKLFAQFVCHYAFRFYYAAALFHRLEHPLC